MNNEDPVNAGNKLLFLKAIEIYQECKYNTLFFDSATHYIVDFEHVLRELGRVDYRIFMQYFIDNKSKQEVARAIEKSPVSVWRRIKEIEQFVPQRMQEKGMFPISSYFRGYRGLYYIPL